MKRVCLFGSKVFIVVCVALAPFLLEAAATALPAHLVSEGWEEITFDGKNPNNYAVCGPDCIEITTDSSVSMIGKAMPVELSKTPYLSWEWKISQAVTPSNLMVKGEDDRPVAVYVAFPYDSETATFGERLLRPAIELLRGADAPGRMLSYVWGGSGNAGDLVESPYFGGVNAMIVSRVESDPVDTWVAERVNVIADHERAFGRTPSRAAHILLSADSDDTKTRTMAFVRNIGFSMNSGQE